MRFFRRRWRSGPLLQDDTTNLRVLGDVPAADLYGLRLEDLPQGNSYLISTAQSSASFVIGGVFGIPLVADAVGALNAVGSSTAEAVVTVNVAGTTSIAGEALLAPTITLTNPGFETGDTTGWDVLSGAGMTILTATPKTGTYYVAIGQEPQSASGQTHDLPSELLTLADLGLLEMRLAWGGAGFGGDGDAGMPCLEFYDDVGGAGNLIGMHSAPRTDYPTIPAWANLETEAWVPSGTRSVRIQLRGVRGGGSENSVYFDDISTRFLQRPNPHIQTQFMLGNETTGWTATTGSAANLVAATRGPWRNASGGLGYETLTHVTSDFVGYRDTEVPASQITGVDAGLALVELTAQLQSADTSDTIRVWIEALDASAVSLGTVVENSPTAVQASVNSNPLRAVAALPVGTRTLRYWQQMVRTAGTNAIGASRVGIQIEAPVEAAVVSAVMSATAAGALTGVGSEVIGAELVAAAAGTLAAKGTLAAVEYIGSMQLNYIAPASPKNSALTGWDLTGPGGSNLIQQGDLIVIAITLGWQSDIALTLKDEETGDDYTVVGSRQYVDGASYDTNLIVAYYRKVTTTAPTRLLFTAVGAETGQAILLGDLWRGTDPTDPIGAVEIATGLETTRPTIPAIQTTREGSIIAINVGAAPVPAGTAYTGHGLTNYRQADENSGFVNEVLVTRGHKVITTDVVFPSTTWGGGPGVIAGSSWAAIAYEVAGYVPDPGSGVLAAAATGALAAVGASTAEAEFYADAFIDDGISGFVSESAAQTEAVFDSAAVSEFLAVGTGVVQADLAADGAGAMNLVTTAIGSGEMAASGVGVFDVFGDALVPGAMSVTAAGGLAASSSAILSGTLTSSAAGAASFPGQVTFSAVLSAAGAGAASLVTTAISSGDLTTSAISTAVFGSLAVAPAVLSAAAAAATSYSGGATISAVLGGQAVSEAVFWIDSVAGASLSADASGLLSAVGGYAGSSGNSLRFVVEVRLLRQIAVAQEDRVVVIEPETRTVIMEREDRVVYVGPLPRDTIQ